MRFARTLSCSDQYIYIYKQTNINWDELILVSEETKY